METGNPAFSSQHNIVLRIVASWYRRSVHCCSRCTIAHLCLALVLLVSASNVIFRFISSPLNSTARYIDTASSHIAATEHTSIAVVVQSNIVAMAPPKSNILANTVFSSSDVVYPMVSIKSPGAVIVFLHIQKTGGLTFRHHLLNNTELGPCKNYHIRSPTSYPSPVPSKCVRRQIPGLQRSYWLFSPYSLGTSWPCGVHPDLTTLKLERCAQRVLDRAERKKGKERRYFYITILREPIKRYISEFRHVQRGATWKGSRLLCKGRSPTAEELPPCYQSHTWRKVTLDEFISCPNNLANNRQTRMLADLRLVDCYNRSAMLPAERNRIMLASAKDNLRSMVFFGLTEYQRPSQYMFERTFNLMFVRLIEQSNRSRSKDMPISHAQYKRILSLNSLDIELYKFARELFLQRFKHFKELNPRTSANEYDTQQGKTKDGATTSLSSFPADRPAPIKLSIISV